MPKFGPLKLKDLIKSLRKYGFDGPYAGDKHHFMVKGDLSISIPNPHGEDIRRELLKRILRQARDIKNGMGKIIKVQDRHCFGFRIC